MAQNDKRGRFFDEDQAPLPLHLQLMDNMATLEWASRFTSSAVARTNRYDCISFYKHISRPVCLPGDEEDRHAGE